MALIFGSLGMQANSDKRVKSIKELQAESRAKFNKKAKNNPRLSNAMKMLQQLGQKAAAAQKENQAMDEAYENRQKKKRKKLN